MPLPLPPKPTLRRATVEETRKAMWASWIDECAMIHEVFIEGLLASLERSDVERENG